MEKITLLLLTIWVFASGIMYIILDAEPQRNIVEIQEFNENQL